MRRYGGIDGWKRLQPEARYTTKEEEDADVQVQEQRLMRQDNFLIKKQREREEKKKKALLEKLMNTPPINKRTLRNENKRSKQMTQRFNSFNKGKTVLDRKQRNNHVTAFE